MKRLAWWAIGIGLVFMLAGGVVGVIRYGPTTGVGPGVGPPMLFEVLFFLRGIGDVVFVGGVLLLSATVIADAIAKATATRQSP